MREKRKKELYEKYHEDRKLQRQIISDNNFTYREIIKILKPYLGRCKSILDVGSGVGTIDFYLASKGKKITAIEISENAVNTAKVNAKLFNLDKKIKFIIGKFPNKIPNTKYDLVILSEVIEHLDDDEGAVRNIWRVLKQDGILVITTPSKNAPLYRMGLLDKFDKSVGHLRRYTINELKSLVEKNCYELISIGKHEGILRNFLFTNRFAGKFLRFIRWGISDIVAFMDYLTIPLFGESNIYLVAKKIKRKKE